MRDTSQQKEVSIREIVVCSLTWGTSKPPALGVLPSGPAACINRYRIGVAGLRAPPVPLCHVEHAGLRAGLIAPKMLVYGPKGPESRPVRGAAPS